MTRAQAIQSNQRMCRMWAMDCHSEDGSELEFWIALAARDDCSYSAAVTVANEVFGRGAEVDPTESFVLYVAKRRLNPIADKPDGIND
jgi:hypothetical protein